VVIEEPGEDPVSRVKNALGVLTGSRLVAAPQVALAKAVEEDERTTKAQRKSTEKDEIPSSLWTSSVPL
jgi:hypothetical protein